MAVAFIFHVVTADILIASHQKQSAAGDGGSHNVD